MGSLIQAVYHSAQTLEKSPHFHDCHQIILVVKGSVEFCINGGHIRAGQGDVAIFSRFENHSVGSCSEGYERYVLQLDPEVILGKSAVYALLTDRPAGFCNVVSLAPYMEEVLGLFQKLLREQSSPSRLAEEMEQLLVKQLLITVYRCTSVDFDSIYDHVVTELKRQFEQDFREPCTLSALAKRYHMSASSLSHRFQAATGVSVMGYLQSCRMAHAKQLLADTDLGIGQVVERCGFSDNSNFSRTFKKLNGMSPKAFRKKYQTE